MGGVQTTDNRVNAKVEASLNLRFAESGTKNRAIPVRTGYYGKINTFVRLYNGNCINSERVSKPI